MGHRVPWQSPPIERKVRFRHQGSQELTFQPEPFLLVGTVGQGRRPTKRREALAWKGKFPEPYVDILGLWSYAGPNKFHEGPAHRPNVNQGSQLLPVSKMAAVSDFIIVQKKSLLPPLETDVGALAWQTFLSLGDTCLETPS